jgi:hypothetical protein
MMRRFISTAMLRLRQALREKAPQTCSIKSARVAARCRLGPLQPDVSSRLQMYLQFGVRLSRA